MRLISQIAESVRCRRNRLQITRMPQYMYNNYCNILTRERRNIISEYGSSRP